MNRDGYSDLIVGAYRDDNNGQNSGSARVLSGKDGKILYTFNGDSAGDWFGWSVSGAGDVNRDGYADLIVGAYKDDNNGQNSGSARVLSGKDGKILYTFNGGNADDNFGNSVRSAGDVNRDGYSDLIVGAPQVGFNPTRKRGYARVLSGKDGKTLYTFNGDSAGDWFGVSVAGAGDVNKDGYPDLIVGASHPPPHSNPRWKGYARVLSGKDGKILYTFNSNSVLEYFAFSVSGAGDVNRDGYADLIVGVPRAWDNNNGPRSGSARVLSGKDGKLLYTFKGDSAWDNFGSSVSGAGDVNKDGYADLIVGAWLDANNGSGSGSARVLSGARLTLSSDSHFVSLAKGGTQTVSLDAGSSHAGKVYILLGTLSGTSPGIKLNNSVTLPLNLDAYLNITLAFPNVLHLSTSLGWLDSSGKAMAKFTAIPLFPPALVGLLFHHAYVVIGSSPFDFASNAVPLTLLK